MSLPHRVTIVDLAAWCGSTTGSLTHSYKAWHSLTCERADDETDAIRGDGR
jgi:hypothetical protein